jgi:anti-sigma B factor antagonist
MQLTIYHTSAVAADTVFESVMQRSDEPSEDQVRGAGRIAPRDHAAAVTRDQRNMRLEMHMDGDVAVVALVGSLDGATAPDLREYFDQLVPGRCPVLLDLSQMSFLSSAGLRVLVVICRQAERNGARLTLAGVPAEVRAVMAATGFLEFFTVADTVTAGVQALAA